MITIGCNEKKFGIILYNPSDRDGAVEEADNLQSGLKAVGCQVFREEWTTKVQLNKCMADGLRAADGCSVLIVCVMSHGTAGTLRSEDGDGAVIINDVIFRFQREIPEDTPVVSFMKCLMDGNLTFEANLPQKLTDVMWKEMKLVGFTICRCTLKQPCLRFKFCTAKSI